MVEICEFVIVVMMDLIRDDLKVLNVMMDKFFLEKFLYGIGLIEDVFVLFEVKGLIYEGVFEFLKGKMFEDWELCE